MSQGDEETPPENCNIGPPHIRQAENVTDRAHQTGIGRKTHLAAAVHIADLAQADAEETYRAATASASFGWALPGRQPPCSISTRWQI